MNFAPYQDASPELERVRSPPLKGRNSIETGRTKSPPPQQRPQGHNRNISHVQPLPAPISNSRTPINGPSHTSYTVERGQSLQAFDTSLNMRLDYEAMLAYLFIPPIGGVLLLLLERKSDYVRFHAFQSSMVFTTIFIIHMLLLWSAALSWTLFAFDLLLMAFLAMHAYKGVDTLDHYEFPLFGRLATHFVERE